MSRLSDLLRNLRIENPAIASDLEREIAALRERRAFGLNFERHVPEAVELPGRKVRRGDKVRVLPPRRSRRTKADEALHRVVAIERTGKAATATLETLDGRASTSAPVEDIVVVAEFRDTIYPGLVSTGSVERGGNKPFHTVINAENYHALQALMFAYRGKVDCIYIDPPYNSRDKQWKYNNDYVDADDDYRHSKWLAMMERRLRLAKNLLNPHDAALIVTIDEREVSRLGLLLEQTFPEARIQMVTSVISAKGAVRRGQFSRVEEHIFFVLFGEARIRPWIHNMLPGVDEADGADEAQTHDDDAHETVERIEWLGLRRREPSSVRGSRPNQFYPIFVDAESGVIHSVGDPIDDDVDRSSVAVPEGTVALWPLRPDGSEMLWGLTPEALRKNWAHGFVRVNWKSTKQTGTVKYLPSGTIAGIRTGDVTIEGRRPDGSVEGFYAPDTDATTPPKRLWNMRAHNAETGGTNMLTRLIPGRRFDYPKSLYAVEDTLRFVVGHQPDALVLDFFAGSGTTAHAVMRLNKQDGGCRHSIAVTNNEVSADEQTMLRKRGLRPSDPEWEALGICEYLTKPRIAAALTGRTPAGEPVKGAYKFTDEFPMADGFEENVEFFTLTYQAPLRVASNREFGEVAPLLWLRAGSRGRRIEDISDGWDVADSYAVLADLDHTDAFLAGLRETPAADMVFIVTDEDRLFEAVVRQLPEHVEPVRLYEAYMRNFEIDAGRSTL